MAVALCVCCVYAFLFAYEGGGGLLGTVGGEEIFVLFSSCWGSGSSTWTCASRGCPLALFDKQKFFFSSTRVQRRMYLSPSPFTPRESVTDKRKGANIGV